MHQYQEIMKKIVIIFLLAGMAAFSSCSNYLDTEPTDRISGDQMFTSIDGAEVAMDGFYRLLYLTGWGTSRSDQMAGWHSIMLAADAMGEDFILHEYGSGWYRADYQLMDRTAASSGTRRPYMTWNFFYTLIANTNYILNSEENLRANATPSELNRINFVMGQAYAMRAISYFYLIQIFQQTYKGNESAKGVPIYTTPTTSTSVGAPRGTVQQTYDRINEDIDLAIGLLKQALDANIKQGHISRVDYYVANGFKARISLVQENFAAAETAATEAMKSPGKKILPVADFMGLNSTAKANVLWGSQLIGDQIQHYPALFSHMDSEAGGMYAAGARKCVSSWLYEEIPGGDQRKVWWNKYIAPEDESPSGKNASYNQFKMQFSDRTARLGDYIYMRYEEMVLILAEAQCRQNKFEAARATLSQLMKVRDPEGYETRLEKRTDAAT